MMTLYRGNSDYCVYEFDYSISKEMDSDRKIFNIYVYGLYGEQFEYCNVYDVTTLRLIIKYLVRKGLVLKDIRSKEIDDLLLPFPDDDADDDLDPSAEVELPFY